MGNCCCREKKSNLDCEKEIQKIEHIDEEQKINQLRTQFNPTEFNELFNKRRKKDPESVLMPYFDRRY